jgi:hypothetical protein
VVIVRVVGAVVRVAVTAEAVVWCAVQNWWYWVTRNVFVDGIFKFEAIGDNRWL